ncbi:MAG: hypothetical protein COB69_07110 [Phycisphaera sp.]|nr:MAG: hypothetical protein COB69_07110 [Phycisphaera sp.]
MGEQREWVIGPRLWRWRRIGAAASWIGCAAILAWLGDRVISGMVRGNAGDFRHFFWAAEALRLGEDPYASGTLGYIYPPLFAWAISPLVPLGMAGAGVVWGAVNLILILSSMFFAFKIITNRLKGPRDAATWATVMIAAALLSIDQLRAEVKQGQTDTVVLAAFTLGLYLLGRFPLVAGMVIAIAAQIKHQAALPILYLLVRGRFKPVLGFAVALPLVAVLPMTTMGKDAWGHAMGQSYGYVSQVSAVSEHTGESSLHPIIWEKSISIPSAIARWLDGPEGISMLLLTAIVGTMAAGVFAITWLIYRSLGMPLFSGRWGADNESKQPGVVLIEWAGLIIAMLAFSPQAINRHGFILLFIHMIAAYLIFVPKSGINRWPLIIGVVLYQVGQVIPADYVNTQSLYGLWHFFSGESWCMLAMWFGLVWTGLDAVKKGYPVFKSADQIEPVATA